MAKSFKIPEINLELINKLSELVDNLNAAKISAKKQHFSKSENITKSEAAPVVHRYILRRDSLVSEEVQKLKEENALLSAKAAFYHKNAREIHAAKKLQNSALKRLHYQASRATAVINLLADLNNNPGILIGDHTIRGALDVFYSVCAHLNNTERRYTETLYKICYFMGSIRPMTQYNSLLPNPEPHGYTSVVGMFDIAVNSINTVLIDPSVKNHVVASLNIMLCAGMLKLLVSILHNANYRAYHARAVKFKAIKKHKSKISANKLRDYMQDIVLQLNHHSANVTNGALTSFVTAANEYISVIYGLNSAYEKRVKQHATNSLSITDISKLISFCLSCRNYSDCGVDCNIGDNFMRKALRMEEFLLQEWLPYVIYKAAWEHRDKSCKNTQKNLRSLSISIAGISGNPPSNVYNYLCNTGGRLLNTIKSAVVAYGITPEKCITKKITAEELQAMTNAGLKGLVSQALK